MTITVKHQILRITDFESTKVSLDLMLYDKGSYATWGNFPLVEWILVNIMITTKCTDNIL